ncbi:hypothetical protein M3Y97_00160000 [Aphelenchoides bicaudatus]|nr:hypothetical protein M3Y97_00160000 [Aphelenchoides bicaudatus]
MSEKLIGSGRLGLTVDWAIEKLKNSCSNFQQKLKNGLTVKEVVSTKLSGDSGFMSDVYRCDVHFNGGTEDDTLAYCLKEPSSERMDKILGFDFFPFLKDMHQRECSFYEIFGKTEGLKTPKVFGTKLLTDEDKNGYIFMEFCGSGHHRPIDIAKSLNLEQVLSVVENIAHLHAFALKNKSAWDGQFKSVNIVASTVKECDEVFGRLVGRLKTFCDEDLMARVEDLRDIFFNADIYNYILYDAHKEAGVPSIISHGDLWANNILFEVDKKTDELTNTVGGIVDWQATNAGNPAQDLVRIMLLNMDADVRHASEPKVFAHYYQKLNEYLKELNADPASFSLEQLLNAAKPYFLYQLVLAMFISAHSFHGENQVGKRAIFLERLREGLKQAQKTKHLWQK